MERAMNKSILDAIATLPRALKSIDEHNAETRKAREEAERKLRQTGVACPGCGEELLWLFNTTHSISMYPMSHQRNALCSKCNLTVGLEA
jgi:hypothetical protein